MSDLTPESLDELERLMEAATRSNPRMATELYAKGTAEAAEFVNALKQSAPALLRAARESERLVALVYMPGQWRCPKCELQLTQSNLNAADGSVTARDDPGDKCPNCDSPLWRVSYREAFKDTMKVAEQVIAEKNVMHAELAQLRARLAKAETALRDIIAGNESMRGAHGILLLGDPWEALDSVDEIAKDAIAAYSAKEAGE